MTDQLDIVIDSSKANQDIDALEQSLDRAVSQTDTLSAKLKKLKADAPQKIVVDVEYREAGGPVSKTPDKDSPTWSKFARQSAAQQALPSPESKAVSDSLKSINRELSQQSIALRAIQNAVVAERAVGRSRSGSEIEDKVRSGKAGGKEDITQISPERWLNRIASHTMQMVPIQRDISRKLSEIKVLLRAQGGGGTGGAIVPPVATGGAGTVGWFAEKGPPKQANIWHGSKENAHLSNLASRPFTDKSGRSYHSVEHAYQSWKSGQFDESTYKKYTGAGQKIPGRMGTKTEGGWNIALMEKLIRQSFEQNPQALQQLLATKGQTLTHTQDKGIWAKEFPRILTKIREEGLQGIGRTIDPKTGFETKYMSPAQSKLFKDTGIGVFNIHNKDTGMTGAPWEVYTGRSIKGQQPSILGNYAGAGFDSRTPEGRAASIEAFRQDLWKRVKSGDKDTMRELNRLADIRNKYGKLALMDFCAPKDCHAEVIARAVDYVDRQRKQAEGQIKRKVSESAKATERAVKQQYMSPGQTNIATLHGYPMGVSSSRDQWAIQTRNGRKAFVDVNTMPFNPALMPYQHPGQTKLTTPNQPLYPRAITAFGRSYMSGSPRATSQEIQQWSLYGYGRSLLSASEVNKIDGMVEDTRPQTRPEYWASQQDFFQEEQRRHFPLTGTPGEIDDNVSRVGRAVALSHADKQDLRRRQQEYARAEQARLQKFQQTNRHETSESARRRYEAVMSRQIEEIIQNNLQSGQLKESDVEAYRRKLMNTVLNDFDRKPELFTPEAITTADYNRQREAEKLSDADAAERRVAEKNARKAAAEAERISNITRNDPGLRTMPEYLNRVGDDHMWDPDYKTPRERRTERDYQRKLPANEIAALARNKQFESWFMPAGTEPSGHIQTHGELNKRFAAAERRKQTELDNIQLREIERRPDGIDRIAQAARTRQTAIDNIQLRAIERRPDGEDIIFDAADKRQKFIDSLGPKTKEIDREQTKTQRWNQAVDSMQDGSKTLPPSTTRRFDKIPVRAEDLLSSAQLAERDRMTSEHEKVFARQFSSKALIDTNKDAVKSSENLLAAEQHLAKSKKELNDYRRDGLALIEREIKKQNEAGKMMLPHEQERFRKQQIQNLEDSMRKEIQKNKELEDSRNRLAKEYQSDAKKMGQAIAERHRSLKTLEKVEADYRKKADAGRLTKAEEDLYRDTIKPRMAQERQDLNYYKNQLSEHRRYQDMIQKTGMSLRDLKTIEENYGKSLRRTAQGYREAGEVLRKQGILGYGSEKRVHNFPRLRTGDTIGTPPGKGGWDSDRLTQVPQNPLMGRMAQFGMMASGLAASVFLVQMIGTQIANLINIIRTFEDSIESITESVKMTDEEIKELPNVIRHYSNQMGISTAAFATATEVALKSGLSGNREDIAELYGLQRSQNIGDYSEATLLTRLSQDSDFFADIRKDYMQQWYRYSGRDSEGQFQIDPQTGKKQLGSFGYEWERLLGAGKESVLEIFFKDGTEYGERLKRTMADLTEWLNTNQATFGQWADNVGSGINVLVKAFQLMGRELLIIGGLWASWQIGALAVGGIKMLSTAVMKMVANLKIARSAIASTGASMVGLDMGMAGVVKTSTGLGAVFKGLGRTIVSALGPALAIFAALKAGMYLFDKYQEYKKEGDLTRANDDIDLTGKTFTEAAKYLPGLDEEIQIREKAIHEIEQKMKDLEGLPSNQITGRAQFSGGENVIDNYEKRKESEQERLDILKEQRATIREMEEIEAFGRSFKGIYELKEILTVLQDINKELGFMPEELVVYERGQIQIDRKKITDIAGGDVADALTRYRLFKQDVNANAQTAQDYEIALATASSEKASGFNQWESKRFELEYAVKDLTKRRNQLLNGEGVNSIAADRELEAITGTLDQLQKGIDQFSTRSFTQEIAKMIKALADLEREVQKLGMSDMEKKMFDLQQAYPGQDIGELAAAERKIFTHKIQQDFLKARGRNPDLVRQIRDIQNFFEGSEEEKSGMIGYLEWQNLDKKLQHKLSQIKDIDTEFGYVPTIELEWEIKDEELTNRLKNLKTITEEEYAWFKKRNDELKTFKITNIDIGRQLFVEEFKSKEVGYTTEREKELTIQKRYLDLIPKLAEALKSLSDEERAAIETAVKHRIEREETKKQLESVVSAYSDVDAILGNLSSIASDQAKEKLAEIKTKNYSRLFPELDPEYIRKKVRESMEIIWSEKKAFSEMSGIGSEVQGLTGIQTQSTYLANLGKINEEYKDNIKLAEEAEKRVGQAYSEEMKVMADVIRIRKEANATIEYLLNKPDGTMSDGIAAYFLEMRREMENTAKFWYDMMKGVHEDLAAGFSNLMYDAVKGVGMFGDTELTPVNSVDDLYGLREDRDGKQGLGDYFSGMFDNALKRVTDNLGNRVAKGILGPFAELFIGQGSPEEIQASQLEELVKIRKAITGEKSSNTDSILGGIFGSLWNKIGGAFGFDMSGSGSGGGSWTSQIGQTLAGHGLKWVGGKLGINDAVGNLFGVGSTATSYSTGSVANTMMADKILATNTASTAGGSFLASAGTASFAAAAAYVLSSAIGKLLQDEPRISVSGTPYYYYAARGAYGADQDHNGVPITVGRHTGEHFKSQKYDYYIRVTDTGQDPQIASLVYDYFDNYFEAIENVLGNSVNDILNEKKNSLYAGIAMHKGGTFEELSQKMFSQLVDSFLIDLFPDAGKMMHDVQVVTGTRLEYISALEIAQKKWDLAYAEASGRGKEDMGRRPTGHKRDSNYHGGQWIRLPVYGTEQREVSEMSEYFDTPFFKSLAPEEGTEWDGFLRFAEVVQETDQFLEKFNKQMEQTGITALSAFENIEAIETLMSGIRASVDSVMKGTSLTNELTAIDEQFKNLENTLNNLHATTEDLTEAEESRHLLLGTLFTGFTAQSLQSGLSESDGLLIESFTSQAIIDTMAAQAAESIMHKFLEPVSIAAGEIWDKTGDINKVFEEIEKHDLTGAQQAVDDFNASIEHLRETATKSTEAMQKTLGNLLTYTYNALDREDLAKKVDQIMTLIELDDLFHPLQKFIWAMEDAQKTVLDWSSALESIQLAIDSIMVDSDLPQSRAYMDARYDALLAEAQKDPEKISNFTGFTGTYIDFIKGYGTPDVVDKVLADLMALESKAQTEISMAEEITGGKTLSDLYAILARLPEDMIEIFRPKFNEFDYLTSKLSSLRASSEHGEEWSDKNIWDLKSFMANVGLTPEQHYMQYGMFEGISPTTTFNQDAYLTAKLTSLQTNPETAVAWAEKGINDLIAAFQNAGMTALEHYLKYGINENLPGFDYGNLFPGFADGGIISGPVSGYTIPTTFHGIEHIIPNQDMQDIKALMTFLVENISANDSDQTIQVKVYIGDRELKDVTLETIKDLDTQDYIKRISAL